MDPFVPSGGVGRSRGYVWIGSLIHSVIAPTSRSIPKLQHHPLFVWSYWFALRWIQSRLTLQSKVVRKGIVGEQETFSSGHSLGWFGDQFQQFGAALLQRGTPHYHYSIFFIFRGTALTVQIAYLRSLQLGLKRHRVIAFRNSGWYPGTHA